ncbi:5424_t:CDS:2, partial [Acaulospora morrowiae]
TTGIIKEITENYFVANETDVDVGIGQQGDDGCIPLYVNIVGIIGIAGTLCPSDHSLNACITALGYNAGCLEGDINQGIELDIDLCLVKGVLKFYLNSSCLYVSYSLNPLWGSGYEGNASPVAIFVVEVAVIVADVRACGCVHTKYRDCGCLSPLLGTPYNMIEIVMINCLLPNSFDALITSKYAALKFIATSDFSRKSIKTVGELNNILRSAKPGQVFYQLEIEMPESFLLDKEDVVVIRFFRPDFILVIEENNQKYLMIGDAKWSKYPPLEFVLYIDVE